MTSAPRSGPLAGMRGRMANQAELVAALTSPFKQRPASEWLALLQKAGVPAGPVLSVLEMHTHPQTQARDMAQVGQHTTAGDVETLGLPFKFSGTPGSIDRAALVYGEHSRAILNHAGYSNSEIEDLVAESVVAEPSRSPGAHNA